MIPQSDNSTTPTVDAMAYFLTEQLMMRYKHRFHGMTHKEIFELLREMINLWLMERAKAGLWG